MDSIGSSSRSDTAGAIRKVLDWRRTYFAPSIIDDVKSVLPTFRSADQQRTGPAPSTTTVSTNTTWTSARDERPAPSSPSSSIWSNSSAPTPSTSYSSSSVLSSLKAYMPEDPRVSAAASAVAAVGLTLGSLQAYRRYGRRIRNADYVTSGMLDRKIWVKGKVTSVGDGDNFRLFHTPLLYSAPVKLRSVPTNRKDLKDETLHIRIAGVDAPEAAHFGNPAQPHSAESLAWLRSTLTGKTVRCQLLRKDQYNRIVALPYIYRWYWTDMPLPLIMLKEGMAVVYTSAGSEYGPWGLEKMQALEKEAKRQKKGLWKLKNFESPGEYKKRMKIGEEAPVAERSAGRGRAASSSWSLWSIVKRVLGR